MRDICVRSTATLTDEDRIWHGRSCEAFMQRDRSETGSNAMSHAWEFHSVISDRFKTCRWQCTKCKAIVHGKKARKPVAEYVKWYEVENAKREARTEMFQRLTYPISGRVSSNIPNTPWNDIIYHKKYNDGMKTCDEICIERDNKIVSKILND